MKDIFVSLFFTIIILESCSSKNIDDKALSKSNISQVVSSTYSIFFLTDLSGSIEPCGCVDNMLGGLDKIAHIAESTPHDLLLHSGNFLFPKELNEKKSKQDYEKAKVIVSVFEKLSLSASTFGLNDTDTMNRIVTDNADNSFFSKLSSKLPLTQNKIFSLKNNNFIVLLKVLSQSNTLDFESETNEILKHTDYNKSKLKILLLQTHNKADTSALEYFSKIFDLIVLSPGTEIGKKVPPPKMVNKSLVFEAGSEGQFLAYLQIPSELLLSQKNQNDLVFSHTIDFTEWKQTYEIQRLEERIASYHHEILSFEKDKEKNRENIHIRKERIVQHQQEIQERKNEISKMQNESNQAVPVLTLLPITKTIPGSAWVQELKKSYNDTLQRINSLSSDNAQCIIRNGEAHYIGSENCKACHAPAYDFWKQTRHGKAWNTLEKQQKTFDYDCIGCHSIGFEKPGGYCNAKDVTPFIDVGCESCHGPGSKHAKLPVKGSMLRAVPKNTCEPCHNQRHSPQFHYESYLPKVIGKGHGL